MNASEAKEHTDAIHAEAPKDDRIGVIEGLIEKAVSLGRYHIVISLQPDDVTRHFGFLGYKTRELPNPMAACNGDPTNLLMIEWR